MKRSIYFLFLLFISVLAACKKDKDDDGDKTPDPVDTTTTSTVGIRFEHLFDTRPFNLNAATPYVTTQGDSLTFTTFRYYISNIVLTKEDGSSWTQPESYYLVDAVTANAGRISVTGVPFGNYTSIRFTVGVDSTRNVSGSQTGALDPVHEMYWDWNTGYVFLKAEGNSPQSGMGGSFMYHIGGVGGDQAAQQLIEGDLSAHGDHGGSHGEAEPLVVKKGSSSSIHFHVDVHKMFSGPNPVFLSTLPMVHMPGEHARHIAENYKHMFRLDHIHN